MTVERAEELVIESSDITTDAIANTPVQHELPLAIVNGQPFTDLPHDLYIPPEALEVFLDTFEGPLDLLLYLIRRQNLDILDIPVARITQQYMGYVELMKVARLELAAEYLVMAAMLAEIKSRMLLPRQEQQIEEEDDPRAELIRRLQEYERFHQAAVDLDALPRVGREIMLTHAAVPKLDAPSADPEVSLTELLASLTDVLNRADMFESHEISPEVLSTRERMADILERLKGGQFVPFSTLYDHSEGSLGVVVTFMAVLELVKEQLIDLVQSEPFAPIHLKVRHDDAAGD